MRTYWELVLASTASPATVYFFIAMNIPTIFAVMSLCEHGKIVRNKIIWRDLRRYKLSRAGYVIGYLILHNASIFFMQPLFFADDNLGIPPMVYALPVLLYWGALICLLRLEAGCAIAMLLVLSFAPMVAWSCFFSTIGWDQQTIDGVVFAITIMRMLLVAVKFEADGNPLAQRYFNIDHVNDLAGKV